ncbi:MAG: hypothetical protein IKW45_06450 [Clostridia bacterium]|nr:hypothetical protein [Clostridia bacterium]
MMRNPVEMMLQNMARQSGGNMQGMAQQILKNNPEFSKAIQGQNLQDLAMKTMQQRGINPQQIMQMFRK